jgi:hypothetical protein
MSSHPLPLTSSQTKAVSPDQQINPILRNLIPRQKETTPGTRESIRPLSCYNETQQRVLASRCYALRHIHQKNDVEVSAALDVRIEDLDTLWRPANTPKWQVPDPHGLSEFRARQKQGLGPDDLV